MFGGIHDLVPQNVEQAPVGDGSRNCQANRQILPAVKSINVANIPYHARAGPILSMRFLRFSMPKSFFF